MADPRVKTATGPTILLASGHYFDLLDPANSRFNLADIARGLGNTCRFAGQCDRFYSVAEHTWLASFLVPQPLAFAALMHDAPEAFIGDVTRPLKGLLPAYKEIENRIADVIAERFLLGDLCDHPMVKRADLQMLAAEQLAMMPTHDDAWHCLEGIDVPALDWQNWSPVDAAKNWLHRAEVLINRFPGHDVESLLS
ncbi:hypothetical protein [Sphingomonas sp. CFBP 13720]|uniref:hypothetical protein n=1 Tax=Sphingomonas sp. CFBP 13720 TaxID=2775302 RepID=UPI001785BA96|nr:hypothetical protein [Sphingomonas sp. CFBP 13720]MBD8677952.1 hypothetical protein [Sphingomonas sp. CFBP 13720]